MWWINQRVNKLGQSLWRTICSPNWSISPCGCQDTCGLALWCEELVQAPAVLRTHKMAPHVGAIWATEGRRVCFLMCVSETMYFWWLRVFGANVHALFFVCFCLLKLLFWAITWFSEKSEDMSWEPPVTLSIQSVYVVAGSIWLVAPVPLTALTLLNSWYGPSAGLCLAWA